MSPLAAAVAFVRATAAGLRLGWRLHMQRIHELERAATGFAMLRDELHTLDNCYTEECQVCGVLHCPELDPLHFHHDGCPVCGLDWDFAEAEQP